MTVTADHLQRLFGRPAAVTRRGGAMRAIVFSILQIALIWTVVWLTIGKSAPGLRWLDGTYAIVGSAVLLTGLVLLAALRTFNLTVQSEAMRRAADERRLLAAIVDAPSALIAVVDGDSNVVYANASFREVVGGEADPRNAFRDSALRGADVVLAFTTSGKERTAEVDVELVRPGEPARILHFWLSRQPLLGGGEHTIAVGHDETLRLQAQRTLVQTAKLVSLGEVTSGVAHELSQPLNVIRMAAQNALAEIESDEGERLDVAGGSAMPDPEFRPFVAAKLHRVIAQVDRAAALISRMRIFSRAGRQGLVRFDVRSACRSALVSVEQQFRSAGVSIRERLGEEPLMVVGHQALLEQVIVDLLTNACDALDNVPIGNRTVEVGASRGPADKISVFVSDSGPGVSVAIRDRIFEPFFTTKPMRQGLGLATAFGIMHDIGGALSLVNDGVGATFQIDLPADRPGHAAAPGGAPR